MNIYSKRGLRGPRGMFGRGRGSGSRFPSKTCEAIKEILLRLLAMFDDNRGGGVSAHGNFGVTGAGNSLTDFLGAEPFVRPTTVEAL